MEAKKEVIDSLDHYQPGNYIDIIHTIDAYIRQVDWRVRENSGEDYSFSGLMMYTAGKVVANYALNKVYTLEISSSHRDGFIHIHDLNQSFVGYCGGWSLTQLLTMGFGNIANKTNAKPPKHIDACVHQMVNFIDCLQMEFAGAQAFSSVDTLLAPFVRVDRLSYDYIKQSMQELIYSLNVPSRWGLQCSFSNISFDWTVPDDLRDQNAIVGGKIQNFTYGDCQREMDIINKAFLEVLWEGDANGCLFSFPIPTYNLTREFDWSSKNAELLFKLTSKYGSPYFQNYIGSDLDPNSIRAMCCRLNIDQKQLLNRPGGMWSIGESTGSLGVVTINMNRLGYISKNKGELFAHLEKYMGIAKASLEIKRGIVEHNLANGLMPYTKIYIGSFKNHFSTIGLCGMNECCLNFLGHGIRSEVGKKLAIDVLRFMREKLLFFQAETGNLYNLEATPAESASYRLAAMDRKYYPDIITAGGETPYLTNSTQLGVDDTDDIVEALEHQNDIQKLYTGGTIFHTFLGEQIDSAESCKRLVRKIAENTALPYFSITPTFSICRNHGYLSGQQAICPDCRSETEIYSRIVGYYRPVKNWNTGKKEEFDNRMTFKKGICSDDDAAN